MKNYYDILGVSQSAEFEVIKAAYRALAKKYHPDIFLGDKSFSEEKLKEINEAFDVLGDTEKRSAYDKKFSGFSNSGGFEKESEFQSEASGETVLQDEWKTLVEVYPEAETTRQSLYRLSKKLGFSYQVVLLSTKSADKSFKVGEQLRLEYLEKYFGSNKIAHDFAEFVIQNNKRHIASELNKKIALLGSNSADRILFDLNKKYRNELAQLNPWKSDTHPKSTERSANKTTKENWWSAHLVLNLTILFLILIFLMVSGFIG